MNFVVGVCRGHTPDIRNCYEGENGQKKIRRAKRNTYPYPTTSFHFRSLPDTGPLYFRDIYPGLSRRRRLNRGRRGKGRRKADEDGRKEEVCFIVRRVDRSCS